MFKRSIQKRILGTITKSRQNLLIFTLEAVIIALFIVAALLQNRGTFTVSVPRADMVQYGLVLSDTADFAQPRQRIDSRPLADTWNITETDIPADVAEIDGEHNGANYIAYTFYVKNIGTERVGYNVTADIEEVYLGVDAAMRFKVYINRDEPVRYAKVSASGAPEPGTAAFLNETRMLSHSGRELDPDQADRYSVVIWLEGEDPECINDILGGFIKMSMTFRAIPLENDQPSAA